MDNIIERQINGLKSLVGNTPLLAISFSYKGETRKLYAKAEYLNMTGSIKDRMALYIFRKAYQKGTLVPGQLIAEATSGNTGISIAAIGRAMGHPVRIFMPNWLSNERINLIQSLGAKVTLVSKEEGGFLGSIRMTEELAESEGAFLPRQFSNNDNLEAHYNSTAPEIWWQLRFHSLYPDAFIAGVGTGGTIMGTGRYLKEKHNKIRLYALEPENSPTLSTGEKSKVGKHRIQGISDEFIPPIVNLKELDGIIGVDDGDSIIMAQKLASQLGIAVGISSGANFLGALKVQEKLGKNAIVVTVFADDNKKYLSTDLLREEPVRDTHISKDVELIEFNAFKRVCHTCCDPEECAENEPIHLLDEGGVLPRCPRRLS